jgi:hypothetical protein
MKFSLSGLKELRTTIPGLVIIAGATYAMVQGLCSFERWYEVILVALAIIGGTGALLAEAKEKK